MDTWKFLAGLGLFLYGMNLMEHVLKKVSGRSFKIFLREYTQNTGKAIIGGTLITAVLQSSSVVSLLVLAFVGAGIITFRNALGVILGSNLGTTLSSWIVATVGFKLDIESYAMPVIAVTAIVMFFVHRRKKLYNILRILFSIGVIFLGLAFMKTGADGLVEQVNIQQLANYNALVFVLAGFILTTIIQSSSATVAIALTALHANAVTFSSAAALVIGSELGTTIKIVLAAGKGSPDKKRVAWGNVTFNATTTLIAFFTLPWLVGFIQHTMNIHDPLIGLVFFQSSINFLSIAVFLPFINPFSRWLENRFKDTDHNETTFINRDFPAVPELVVDAMHQETESLIQKTLQYHRHVMGIQTSAMGFLQSLTHTSGTSDHLYEKLKRIEGEMLQYRVRLQPEDLDQEQHQQISRCLTSVRHSIHAAKSVRDIQHNLHELESSGNDNLHNHYRLLQQDWEMFDRHFQELQSLTDSEKIYTTMATAMRAAFQAQHNHNEEIINALKIHHLTQVETSTLMNVHRELLSAKKSMLRAWSHLKLSNELAERFEFLPED